MLSSTKITSSWAGPLFCWITTRTYEKKTRIYVTRNKRIYETRTDYIRRPACPHWQLMK